MAASDSSPNLRQDGQHPFVQTVDLLSLGSPDAHLVEHDVEESLTPGLVLVR